MRYLVLLILILFSLSLSARNKDKDRNKRNPKHCRIFDYAAKMLKPKAFMKEVRERKMKGLSEPEIELPSVESARNYVLNFPSFEKFGFGKFSPAKGWKKYRGHLKGSKGYDKFVGWSKKLPNGNFARFRVDFDPVKGGHYNIEFKIKNKKNHTSETLKVAVDFKCKGHKCTEEEFEKIIHLINRQNN